MDPDELLRAMGGDDVSPLDNIDMFGASGGGGGGGRGKGPPPPEKFISPNEAEAMLRGVPLPPPTDNDFDTSCDELDDEDGDVDDVDDLYNNRRDPRRPRHKKSRLFCFGCWFTTQDDTHSADQFIDGSKVNNLLRLFYTNKGHIEDKVLAKMCHEYFKSEIYNPVKREGREIHMWRTRDIYEHMTEHQLDGRIIVARQIQEYQQLSHALNLASFEKTAGGTGVRPHAANIALKLRVDGHVLRLYGLNEEKFLFRNKECTIDFGQMSTLMGPFRAFAQLEQ